MQKLEGTAMTELVEGGKLKRADILLAHSKGSYWGWLIRLGTRCYWNHALILYMVRDLNQGYDEALIIDPKMGSIHVDNITHYFENPNRYDVAVKRLDKEWFHSETGGLSYCQTVCDIALRETTDKFDPFHFKNLGNSRYSLHLALFTPFTIKFSSTRPTDL